MKVAMTRPWPCPCFWRMLHFALFRIYCLSLNVSGWNEWDGYIDSSPAFYRMCVWVPITQWVRSSLIDVADRGSFWKYRDEPRWWKCCAGRGIWFWWQIVKEMMIESLQRKKTPQVVWIFFSDLDGIRTRTQDYLSCQCSCLVSLKKAHEKGNQINQKDLKCLLLNHHVVKAKCHSQNVMFLVIFFQYLL